MIRFYVLFLMLVMATFVNAQVEVEFPVVEPNDDMEEYLAGGVQTPGTLDANSSDLELGVETFDGNSTPQLVGVRFQNVALEADAEILGAYIQFTVDETSPNEPASFTIRAQMDPNPAGFENVMNNISSRPTFATTVTWEPAPWPAVGVAGPDQRTADLSALLMEVLAQDGWAAGNSIVFTIEGDGMRTAESYNGDADAAAKLVVLLPEPTSQGLIGCEATPVPDGNREFELSVLGTYNTGVFDGAAAEIVDYDPVSQRLFFTNADANSVTILDISNPASPTLVNDIDMTPFGGGVNSLLVKTDINTGQQLVIAAVQANTVDGNGNVVVMDTNGGVFGAIPVGVLPDMITCAPDGTLLTANEGEPSDDYMTDPLGTVSLIRTNGDVITIDFTDFNDQKESLINEGVRIFGPNATVAQDLEPEYITMADDSTAYVVMQENNAFAVININTAEVLDILPLGYKNHNSGQPILNEYRLNELVDLPVLGTPTYGGGQPPVLLGGFSGLFFAESESTDENYVFYAVPDRGPNDAAVNRNNVMPMSETNLRPFKLPDYQGRVAKFTLNITTGEVTLDDQIFLTRADGVTPISGRGNIPGFDETPVVPADPGPSGTGNIFFDDFESGNLDNFQTFSVTSDANWEVITTSGDQVAQMNGFGADEASEDWLIAPLFVGFSPFYLSFSSIKEFDGGDFQLLASTDYAGSGDPNNATWDDITDQAILSPGDGIETFSGDIDLSAYGSGSLNVAWRYISTGTGGGDGARWRLDDVSFSDTPLAAGDYEDNDGNLYNALEFDEFGGDFESVLRDPNGGFWMCDEYRPAIYHFDATGTLINRFVPEGTSMLGTTPQPAGTYGTETLPAVYAKRRANRGFEGMALNTDDGYLYAFIQSPIENPNNSVRNMTDVIRVLVVNPADGMPVAEYVYLLEANANRGYDIGRVDKIGDVVYAGNGKFLVLERDSSFPGQDEGKKYIFEVNLTGATNILGTEISMEDGMSGMTLEQMSADQIVAVGVTPLHKTKVLNLPSIGYLPSDKPEGIALLPNGAIAVLNDNDFGIAGAGVSDNSTLGIIEFCDDNALDASNDDDAINIQNYPILGMYQPDAIAGYSVDGRAYIVTANEGDARDYDEFSEEVRVRDLTLDPTAFPNAAELQADEVLGRLRCTDQLGDLDDDGDYDQIYSYGARSFSIFDRYGNLVFDSGNDFERIIAEEYADDFNSNNDENGSFDSRSDDKGPEPEAIEIVTKGDTTYALIGLERIGGIMVYNITDPAQPYFVNYVNNRNFDVDAQLPDGASNPEAGDLGVEDIIYIAAEQSPNGQPLVVTANEVSGTISIFGVEFDKRGFELRIVHNNDGESKIVADTLTDMRPFGGADRFKTIADGLRAQATPSIMLSSGDNFLPGPTFNASLNRAEGLPLYDSEVLDAIGYDALAIGNHDFDFGPDILQRIIEETAASDATFVSANLDFTAEPGLQALVDNGRIAKRTVVDRDGEQIGIIGLTTPALPTISSPRNVVVDENLIGAAQQEVDELIAEGVNKIILVSHLQSINEEIELISQLTDIDVVIAGGGDELLTNDPMTNELGGLVATDSYPVRTLDANQDTVYLVTTPGEYRYVGNLIVEFDEEGEVIRINDESDVIPVVGDIESDPELAMIVDSILLYNQDLAENIVAITEVDLDGLRPNVRTIETNQGNLITDAYLWYYDEVAGDFNFDPSIPVIAVQNGGGIRNDEIIPADSEISELKTFEMLPFSNFVSVIEPVSPETLKSVLEHSVSDVENVNGRFLQVGGFEIVWDPAGVAGESRIWRAALNDGTVMVEDYNVVAGAPDVYIVTNSFTAGGGDDYEDFAATTFTNIGPSYQRVLFDYLLAENGVNGVITAEQYPAGGEGRIRTLDDLTTTVTLNVDMSLIVEEGGVVAPEGVHVAGDFQGWDPAGTPMNDLGNNIWSITFQQEANTTIQYKFINGNEWGADETQITEDCGVDGGSGSFNRILEVGEDPVETPIYCFDYCVICDEVSSIDEVSG
jgi:2',3'-cyclic-nucleotide 2'-phosphodiesterase (5'-nucleotidase family)